MEVADGPRIAFRPCAADGKIASARLRAFLPCRYLGAAGWRTEIMGPDADLDAGYDCVVFQKPYGAADLAVLRRLSSRGVKTIVDVCDNFFYNPEGLPQMAERASRLREMVDAADGVTVSVDGLADLLAPRRVHVVADALDELPRSRFSGLRAGTDERRRWGWQSPSLRLVWFGNSVSEGQPFGIQFLADVLPAVEAAHRRLPVSLTVISNSRRLFDLTCGASPVPTRYIPWTQHDFVRRFTSCDVCLIPLRRNPLTEYKSNNRLLLALSLGVPVIADMIPSYEEFGAWVLQGNWEQSIVTYGAQADVRRQHVLAAQAHIRHTYTAERVVSQWAEAFRSTLEI
ncbi:MAG: hypothetical protein QOH36_37 [Actinomycetota bacterium]|nr:hypothetical protein [Actinomycetota bacterium]